jgi:hypothetical protein
MFMDNKNQTEEKSTKIKQKKNQAEETKFKKERINNSTK